MTYIANPIYDVVFKFLMEDNRVAKVLLSALLKKEVAELVMRPQEFTKQTRTRISLFRIDFSATLRNEDGSEYMVTIELQKTWLPTETLRFRQYLGAQYLNPDNVDADTRYGVPLITIYILGHQLGHLSEPVVYVNRRYLDYDNQVIGQKDPFIESLTHDSIVVQLPQLKGRMRNHLEQLLTVFDQQHRFSSDEHQLKIENDENNKELNLLIQRLEKAYAAPEIREEMNIEDEFLSELENRDTVVMKQKEQLEQQKQQLEQQKKQLEQENQVIEQMKKEKEEMIRKLMAKGITMEEIRGLSEEDS